MARASLMECLPFSILILFHTQLLARVELRADLAIDKVLALPNSSCKLMFCEEHSVTHQLQSGLCANSCSLAAAGRETGTELLLQFGSWESLPRISLVKA